MSTSPSRRSREGPFLSFVTPRMRTPKLDKRKTQRREAAKKVALAQFGRRVKAAAATKKVRNGDLKAGQPCFFYCDACGIFIEKLPEDYLFPPSKLCSQCKGLEEQGWLQQAKVPAEAKRTIARPGSEWLLTQRTAEHKPLTMYNDYSYNF